MSKAPLPSAVSTYTRWRLERETSKAGMPAEVDAVAVEEPLEVRVEGRSVAVMMRTPGHDLDLTRGFLLTEGIVAGVEDIFEISQCPSQDDPNRPGNLVNVLLTHPERVDLDKLSRHVFTSSSCGLCGRATVEAVFQAFPPIDADLSIASEVLFQLPARLRSAQKAFEQTGGLHASALFDVHGTLLQVREDVGRHNALDKLIGWAMASKLLPLNENVLLVSGRLSFELVQKAHCAGIPLISGISAPSSLAIDMAEKSGQTLIGFLRGHTANVYSHPERVRFPNQ